MIYFCKTMTSRAPLVFLSLVAATLLFAQEAQVGQDLGKTRQRLQELQRQTSQIDEQINQLRKRRSGVVVELQGVTLRASKARAQAEAAQLKLGEIRSELNGLSDKKRATAVELGTLRESLKRQAKWLYALGPLGNLSFFPSRGDIENYLTKGRYLEWWRNHEGKKLNRALALHSDLADQEKEIRIAESRFASLNIEMASQIEELRANEKQLFGYLDGIQRDERQKKAIQDQLKEESILLERMLVSVLAKPNPAPALNAPVSFHNLAGRLPRPVEGILAEGFGVQVHPRFGTKTQNNGILIAAKAGDQVKSVAFGRVEKAELFQSFGIMAIIHHGGNYYSVYKHLLALTVSAGQMVKQGDIIGYVGDTPDGPRLGFELRNRAVPEDPQKWFAARYQPSRN
jgi:septal ring factor EnvC (AmiA/AmiB activator)